MSQQPPDEEFERRLRDVLSSRSLGVPVPPDAIDRIHAGARRRQQRRSASAALGAVAVVAVVAGAIGLNSGGGHGSNIAANIHIASPSPTVAAASSASPTPGPLGPASAPASTVPFSSAPPTSPLPQPLASQRTAAGRPAGYTPVSVSAVGLNDYWVLGYTTTIQGAGASVTTTIQRTTDGGQHFESLPGDFSVLQTHLSFPSNDFLVSDLRFGDATDGWAFGPALFSTTDAGASWTAVSGIPGSIVALAAANNTAWAVVQTASSSGASSSAVSNQYALWSTSYGKAAQAWAPVALPVSLGSTTPSIVDQDGTVTLMASGPSRTGNKVHVLIGTAGKPFTDHIGACEQDLGGTLSNSKKAIWAVCPHGNGASLYVSADSGATWTASKANYAVESGAAIGAIDDTTAVTFDAANQRLSKISGSAVAATSAAGISDVTFLGFTTPAVGFAITVGADGTTVQLQRTADGGATWAAVTF